MLNKLRRAMRELRDGKPGRRFVAHHERNRHKHGSAWKSAAYIVAGAALVLAGFLLSLPPGVPGFLLWIPGLGLLVARFRLLAVALDRMEVFGRRMYARLRRGAQRLLA